MHECVCVCTHTHIHTILKNHILGIQKPNLPQETDADSRNFLPEAFPPKDRRTSVNVVAVNQKKSTEKPLSQQKNVLRCWLR